MNDDALMRKTAKQMHDEVLTIIETYCRMVNSSDDLDIDIFQNQILQIAANLIAGVAGTFEIKDIETIKKLLIEGIAPLIDNIIRESSIREKF